VNTADLDRVIRNALTSVAPDLDMGELEPEILIREQADFDSMDTLNFAIALSQALRIDIPEADFGRLASVGECRRYLAERLG
jgi:acyl carrier protein